MAQPARIGGLGVGPGAPTVQLSPGDGTGDDVGRSPHVTLDEDGGVHVAWFGDASYRSCQSSSCNSSGWSTPEALPAQAPDRALDLVAGRDGSGTPVIHLMAHEYYSKRPIGCQSDCWQTPVIDVRPLTDFTSFGSVHLATACRACTTCITWTWRRVQ